jgi:hypothetical protein
MREGPPVMIFLNYELAFLIDSQNIYITEAHEVERMRRVMVDGRRGIKRESIS